MKHEDHAGYQLVKSAHAWLSTNHPALTPFLMGKELRPVLDLKADSPVGHPVKTACTDGNRIWVNLEYALELGFQQTCGLLMEEIYHIALAHPARRGVRHRILWNKACDMAIASILIDEGIDVRGKMCYAPSSTARGPREIYHELKKLSKDNPQQLAVYIPGYQGEGDASEQEGQPAPGPGNPDGGDGDTDPAEGDQGEDSGGQARTDDGQDDGEGQEATSGSGNGGTDEPDDGDQGSGGEGEEQGDEPDDEGGAGGRRRSW